MCQLQYYPVEVIEWASKNLKAVKAFETQLMTVVLTQKPVSFQFLGAEKTKVLQALCGSNHFNLEVTFLGDTDEMYKDQKGGKDFLLKSTESQRAKFSVLHIESSKDSRIPALLPSEWVKLVTLKRIPSDFELIKSSLSL